MGTASRVASDGVANIIRVAVSALSVVAVTPVLSRVLSPAEFSLWILAVSVSAYVMLAEAGVTSAVTRFVSVEWANGDTRDSGHLGDGDLDSRTALSGAAVAIVGVVVFRTSWLFRDIPAELMQQARWTVVVLAASVAISIVGIAAQGYFFAIHRAIVPAMTTVLVRVTMAAALIGAGLRTRSVLWLAAVTLVGALVLSGSIIGLARRSVGRPIASLRLVRRSWVGQLVRHSSTLVWWSIMMLAITGVDILVVGAFDFEKVGGYGIAAQGITFMIALFGAMVAPISAVAARRHAAGHREQVGAIVCESSRISATALVVTSTVLFIAAPSVVGLYAGSQYVDTASVVLRILILGNVIRNLCLPLGLVLVATGDHRRVIAPPFAEAVVNLALSLWWVQVIGANGVAWATCVAATVGVALHLTITLPRTVAFSVSARTFSAQAIPRPSVAAAPAILGFGLELFVGLNSFLTATLVLLASLPLAWFVSLSSADRRRLSVLVHNRLERHRR